MRGWLTSRLDAFAHLKVPYLRPAVLVAAFFWAVGALAQSVDEGAVRSCFADAGPGEHAPMCIGVAMDACSRAGEDTTVAIVGCIQAETDIWDKILNEEYRAVQEQLSNQDPELKTNLRDAQRAWIAYRDAECGLEYARWGLGSMRGIVAANCIMLETAERALELRDKKAF